MLLHSKVRLENDWRQANLGSPSMSSDNTATLPSSQSQSTTQLAQAGEWSTCSGYPAQGRREPKYGQAVKMLDHSPEWYRDNTLLVFQIMARMRWIVQCSSLTRRRRWRWTWGGDLNVFRTWQSQLAFFRPPSWPPLCGFDAMTS